MPNAFSCPGVGTGGGGACLRSLGVPKPSAGDGVAVGAELAADAGALGAVWLRATSDDVSDAATRAAAVKSPELRLRFIAVPPRRRALRAARRSKTVLRALARAAGCAH